MTDTLECTTCEGNGKIVEPARYTGANQHSACQYDCEDCDGTGQIAAPFAMTPETPTPVERVSDLDGLEALRAKATPGPWEACEHIVYLAKAGGFSLHDCPSPEANAALIVAAVNALPDLITRLRAAEANVRKANEGFEEYERRYYLEKDAREAAEAATAAAVGWQDISTAPKEGVVMGWGEYRERDGFSPAFMRFYESVGWSVNAMPFYPTHWQPLPSAPVAGEAK